MKFFVFISTFVFCLTGYAVEQTMTQIINNTEVKFSIKYNEKVSSGQLTYVLFKNITLEADKPVFENTEFNFAYYFFGFHNLCSILGYNHGHDDSSTVLKKIEVQQKVVYVGNHTGDDLRFRFGEGAKGWYVLKDLACYN